MLKRRTSSLRSTITSPATSYFSSSSSLSSAATSSSPLSSSPAGDDDDVQIIDVPLKARLRERKEVPKRTLKRKKKRGAGGVDEFDEDEDESDDGNEDDVSTFSGSEDAHDEEDGEAEDGSDDEYGRNKRSTPLSRQKGGGRPVTREEIAELKAVIGSHLSDGNYVQLIKNAQYDVNLAANNYYAQVGATEEKEDAKEQQRGRKFDRGSASAAPAPVDDDDMQSPMRRAASRSSPRLWNAFTSTSSSPSSSSSPSFGLPLSSSQSSFLGSSFGSSSSSSSSAWPEVRKPSQSYAAPQDNKGSEDESASDDSEPPVHRRGGWGWGRGRQRGGMKMFKGKRGKGMLFDPNALSAEARPAEHTLSAHQRMSAYSVDMDVDAKRDGRWFPMVVTNVFETGHLVEVNHRDWPPECRQMIDPVTNRLAPAGSHADEYYKFQQVDTYITAPPKPPHPDTAQYLWPGQQADEEDDEAADDDSDLLMLLGTLKARVVSDRPVGAKEFYDCLVCAGDGEDEERTWKVMSAWLRKQNKLVVIEETIDEVKVRGQPTPSLTSAQGSKLQDKLHASRDWKVMERWQQDKHDPTVIVRSHHKDTQPDDDWKRSETIDTLLTDMGMIVRHGDSEVLLFERMGGNKAVVDSSDEDMDASDSDGDSDSDSDDEDGAMGPHVLGGLPFSKASSMGAFAGYVNRQSRKAPRKKAGPKGHNTLSAHLQLEPKQRPLHTYAISMTIFLNVSAQRSSPNTTALSLTPLNSLMALLFPDAAQLQAMVKEAEGVVPDPLRDSMKLDVLMSLSVRDEAGRPMFYETFKKREADRIKLEHDEKAEAEQKRKEEEAARRPAKKAVRRGSSKVSNTAGEAEEKKSGEAEGEEKKGTDESFMDIGVGEAEELLSVKCGLTITLRDYQCTTVQWMLEQEAPESNTNMYLWSQLQFPQESLKHLGKRQFASSILSSSSSVSLSASSASAANATVPPLFYYCPLLQRFRFKPLPNLRGGWNVEEMGLGKCFARGTLLRLYDGNVKAVEQFAVNDVLMGDDSGPRVVTSLAYGHAPMYLIQPTWEGATPFTVNGDHILVLTCDAKPYVDVDHCLATSALPRWLVVSLELSTNNCLEKVVERYNDEVTANAALSDRLRDWQPWAWEVSVDDFLSHPTSHQAAVKLIASPAVTFVNPQLPSLQTVLTTILGEKPSAAQASWCAWYLGLWLAVGLSANEQISQGALAQPADVVARLVGYQQLFGESVTSVLDQSSTLRPVRFYQFGDNNSCRPPIVRKLLAAYSLIGNKHIPQAWVCDSLDVRRVILAGIIDGDGCYKLPSGDVYEIAAHQKSVALGYKLLAASLGLRNSKVALDKCVDSQTDQVYCSYRLSLSGDMWDVVQHCSALRKRCPQPDTVDYANKTTEDSRCYGFTITLQPDAEYFGFTVDGANRRFLLEDFTVTHNTIGALALINVERRSQTTAEILAAEEKRQGNSEEKEEKKQDNSRRARYNRRQSREQVKEETEEKEEQAEDELEGERVDDSHADFPSASSSPSASLASSLPSSSSFDEAATLPDSMDNVDEMGRVYTSCTLVVCPVSLVGQWANELAEKSSRPLRICLFHGGSRPRKVAQLLNYDVIITSYGIAASELTLGNNRAKRLIDKTPWLYKGKYAPEYQSLLNRLHFHRVILDESHVIRTANSITCRAAYELVGDRLWMLTGTVVNTSLMDLRGQCKFLDMKGLSVGQVWTDVDNLLVQMKMYENRRADRTGRLRRTLLQKDRLKLLFVNLVTKSMIRHEKRQQFNGRPALISLPPKRVQTIMVQPTADEKRAMDEMFNHAKARFEQYKADNVAVRRSVEVLQLLQPLRIACSGGAVDMVAHRERMKSELDRDAVRSVIEKVREKGSLTADKVELASLAAVSHLTDDCAICLDLLQEPLQTPCRHLFCAECIRGLLLSGRGAEKGTGQCPLCRADLSINQLYKPNVQEEVGDGEEGAEDDEKQPVVRVKKEPGTVVKEKSGRAKKRKVVKSEDGAVEDEEEEKKAGPASSSASSSDGGADTVHFDSKLNKLMSELQAMRAASPLHKALVFTQYLSTMELLKRTMQEHDITYQTLEGHMAMRQRKRNLEEFRSNPECAVFLLSMRSGAVGLTLTAASHVFILEPAINPALEQQAIGRIHRLGNTHKEVVVNYLVMAGSVEENIMQINRDKLELLEKQKRREEDRLARANGLLKQEELHEEDANVRSAAGLDSDDSDNEGAPAPRFGHHHTNANADSGAGINTVSQGSLVQDVALFRIGELDKLFKTSEDRAQVQAPAGPNAKAKAARGKAAKR